MSTIKKVAIGCDHAGYEYKTRLAAHLREHGYEVTDVGCDSAESCHYPIFAHRLCTLIQGGSCDAGILICGTGIGMSIAANKHRSIRAAACSEAFSARLTREHNDANVLCLGARVCDYDTVQSLAELFLTTEFIGGKHETRVAMLTDIENGSFHE